MIINLTSTFVYDAFRVIEALKEESDYYIVSSNVYITSYKTTDIMETLSKMDLINIDGAHIQKSDRLNEFIRNHVYGEDSIAEQRNFIEYYVLNVKPAWAFIIPSGRDELKAYLDYDEFSVFKEANLYSNYDKDTIDWWDTLAEKIRDLVNAKQLDIGRNGEFKTMIYELNRTGRKPTHKAIDSNKLGYDILSVISESNLTPLCIEVKSTESDTGCIFVTRNEWRVANSVQAYVFHIWYCSNKKDKLMILDVNQLKKHIPKESGAGKWTEIKIDISSLIEDYGWKEEFVNE